MNLKKGDTIKLGRILLNVEDFSHTGINQNQESLKKDKNKDDEFKATNQSQQLDDCQYSCKICLSETATAEDPLLSACGCQGSLKYCHLSCLKQWVSAQGKTKVIGNTKIYMYKKLICELCKSQYKTQFKFQNLSYNLLEVKKPLNPYIILKQTSINTKDHCIYVVDLVNSNSCEIGRVFDCHIRLNDISVSRNHASLSLDGENLILKDNKSKFGTLVQVKDTLDLSGIKDKKVILQTGKSILIFEITKKSSVKNIACSPIPKGVEVCKVLKGSLNKCQDDQNDEAKQIEQEESDVIIYDMIDNQQMQDICSIGKEKQIKNLVFNQSIQVGNIQSAYFSGPSHNINSENQGLSQFNTNIQQKPIGVTNVRIEID